ncbi:MAG: hypothetical protein OEX82_02190 [Nitrosomonas sp.]|nr:hypothetical protein [Nitrosomonas sp.]
MDKSIQKSLILTFCMNLYNGDLEVGTSTVLGHRWQVRDRADESARLRLRL